MTLHEAASVFLIIGALVCGFPVVAAENRLPMDMLIGESIAEACVMAEAYKEAYQRIRPQLNTAYNTDIFQQKQANAEYFYALLAIADARCKLEKRE